MVSLQSVLKTQICERLRIRHKCNRNCLLGSINLSQIQLELVVFAISVMVGLSFGDLDVRVNHVWRMSLKIGIVWWSLMVFVCLNCQ